MASLAHLTWFNRAMLLLLGGGVAVALVRSEWLLAGVFGCLLLSMGAVILLASRGRGTDRMRVDAAQPYDERERLLTTRGFAVVGQFAIIAQLGLVLQQVLVAGPRVVDEVVRLLVVSVILGLGNAWASRRA